MASLPPSTPNPFASKDTVNGKALIRQTKNTLPPRSSKPVTDIVPHVSLKIVEATTSEQPAIFEWRELPLFSRCLPAFTPPALSPALSIYFPSAYTHIVGLGANDIKNAVGAQQRWSAGIEAGLPNYNLADPASLTDPVDFSEVFKVEDGKPAVADYEPLVQVRRL